VSGKPAHEFTAAEISPKYALFVTGLQFEDAARRPAAIAGGNTMPHHRVRLVDDVEAQAPEAEGEINVLEVRLEVFWETAGAEDCRAAIKRRASRRAEHAAACEGTEA